MIITGWLKILRLSLYVVFPYINPLKKFCKKKPRHFYRGFPNVLRRMFSLLNDHESGICDLIDRLNPTVSIWYFTSTNAFNFVLQPLSQAV